MNEMAALGAVQVLTGQPRYCKRKRRRPDASVKELWRRAGRPQPDVNDQTEAAQLFDRTGGL